MVGGQKTGVEVDISVQIVHSGSACLCWGFPPLPFLQGVDKKKRQNIYVKKGVTMYSNRSKVYIQIKVKIKSLFILFCGEICYLHH